MSAVDRSRFIRVVAVVAVVAGFALAAGLVARSALSAAQPSDDPAASPLDEPVDNAVVGEPAPDVLFERFDGQPTGMDDWLGEPLVVNFWASWCPPCVAEMRDAFEPLHRELGDRVTFLGVNLQDTEEPARNVIEATGVTYELARDPTGALFTEFGGFGMPTTVLVDASGHVVERHTGSLTRPQLDAFVHEHLLGS